MLQLSEIVKNELLPAADTVKECRIELASIERQIEESEAPARELEVEIETALDLTNSDILQRIEVKSESLTGSDLQVPRSVATEARDKGFGALLVQSAADPDSKNLVIFLDKLPGIPNVLSSRPASFQE